MHRILAGQNSYLQLAAKKAREVSRILAVTPNFTQKLNPKAANAHEAKRQGSANLTVKEGVWKASSKVEEETYYLDSK